MFGSGYTATHWNRYDSGTSTHWNRAGKKQVVVLSILRFTMDLDQSPRSVLTWVIPCNLSGDCSEGTTKKHIWINIDFGAPAATSMMATPGLLSLLPPSIVQPPKTIRPKTPVCSIAILATKMQNGGPWHHGWEKVFASRHKGISGKVVQSE